MTVNLLQIKQLVGLVVFVIIADIGFGQIIETDTVYDPIRVVYSERFVAENGNDKDALQYYTGDVKILHDSTFFLCDSAVTSQNLLKAFDQVTILKSDTIETHSNTLIYNGNSQLAILTDDVVLINGVQQLFTDTLYFDLNTDIASYPDTALMISGTSKLSSRNGLYNLNRKYAYFYRDVIVIDEAFTLLTDTLHYDIASNKASFFGPSFISREATQIYAEGGYYNTNTGDAFFEKNAQYNSETSHAKSHIIRYLPSDGLVILEGNAIVQDSSYYATADRIEYLEKDSTVLLIGNASFRDDESQATGSTIQMNQTTGDIQIYGNGIYQNGSTILASDTILYNEQTQIGKTSGQSIFTDTESNRKLYADNLDYLADGSYIAYNNSLRPYLEQVGEDGDTTYLSADTLYSYSEYRDTLDSEKVEYFLGYPNVIVYSDRFQAIADSLAYAVQDSMLTLYGSPMAWADTSQFGGDTIVMQNDNDGIRGIHLYGKANIINYLDKKHQDQIKGKVIHAKLDSQQMESMKVIGNAETIYFLRDEKGYYIGANKTICSYINFWFKSGELTDVKFHGEPVSEMNPIELAGNDDLYLNQIKWDESRRPKEKEDIFLSDTLSIPTDIVPSSSKIESVLDKEKEVDTFEQEIKSALKRNKQVKNEGSQ